MLKKIAVVGLALVLLVTVLNRWTLAQSTAFLESRLSRLESDSFQIRSELARLESQVYQIAGNRNTLAPRAISPPSPTNPGVTRPAIRSTASYDRLATLVVELRERINKLEARVNQLQR
jgi:outer membrane murein-binding lipoprotein Lpp